MILRDEQAVKIAEFLMQIKAVVLNPESPFTWASGWKSPIYCDNRKTLSFPEVRNAIRDAFVEVIRTEFKEAEVVAGVATGGIALSALVAQALDLPMIYVRSKAKGHGLGNAIEGVVHPGQKVVVIEDLVSTGKSSLNAVEALRKADCAVLGMAAIFTYGFQQAEDNFTSADCTLYTLTDYHHLIDVAVQNNAVSAANISSLQAWRKSPETWGN